MRVELTRDIRFKKTIEVPDDVTDVPSWLADHE